MRYQSRQFLQTVIPSANLDLLAKRRAIIIPGFTNPKSSISFINTFAAAYGTALKHPERAVALIGIDSASQHFTKFGLGLASGVKSAAWTPHWRGELPLIYKSLASFILEDPESPVDVYGHSKGGLLTLISSGLAVHARKKGYLSPEDLNRANLNLADETNFGFAQTVIDHFISKDSLFIGISPPLHGISEASQNSIVVRASNIYTNGAASSFNRSEVLNTYDALQTGPEHFDGLVMGELQSRQNIGEQILSADLVPNNIGRSAQMLLTGGNSLFWQISRLMELTSGDGLCATDVLAEYPNIRKRIISPIDHVAVYVLPVGAAAAVGLAAKNLEDRLFNQLVAS